MIFIIILMLILNYSFYVLCPRLGIFFELLCMDSFYSVHGFLPMSPRMGGTLLAPSEVAMAVH